MASEPLTREAVSWEDARARVAETLGDLLSAAPGAFSSDGFPADNPEIIETEVMDGTQPVRSRLAAFNSEQIATYQRAGAEIDEWKIERRRSYVLDDEAVGAEGIWCIACAEALNTVRNGMCPTCATLAMIKK
jgi:hypothetical protein